MTALLGEDELDRVSGRAGERRQRYRELVRSHYAGGATEMYRRVWGDSFHLAVWSDPDGEVDDVRYTERRVAALGGFGPGSRVLDVGCGIGGPALAIAEDSGADVTGADLLEEHVAIATRRAAERGLSERVRFVRADALALPFDDASFDGVYTFEAPCHMPDFGAFARECARVLRPGASFVGTDWLKADGLDDEAQTRWIEPVCRTFALTGGMVDPSGVSAALRDAGLEVLAVEAGPARATATPGLEEVQREVAREGMAALPPGAVRLIDGGRAIAEASAAGAFVLGWWHARKPAGA